MSAERAIVGQPVRQREPKQTAAQRQAVYDHVWLRDGGACLAPRIDSSAICAGQVQRHHAGLKMGMAKITDPLHCGLLCAEHNVGPWARIHDREVLATIAQREADWEERHGLRS